MYEWLKELMEQGKEVIVFPNDSYKKTATIEKVDRYGVVFRGKSGYWSDGKLRAYNWSHNIIINEI